MYPKSYIHIFPPKKEMAFSSFHLYLPANQRTVTTDNHYVEYRFHYEENAPDVSLQYNQGPNNPANMKLYRIREAYIVKKTGTSFIPVFRALQAGEIGFALREKGAGDFVGGLHGDEVLLDAQITIDGNSFPLDQETFISFETFSFYQQSHIFRCNMPNCKLLLHTQTYTVKNLTLELDQKILWLTDSFPLQNVFLPMITAQRINPDNHDHIISDTVDFFAPNGDLITSYDTSPYGTKNGFSNTEENTLSVCDNTFASSVKIYGKSSGFMVEAGYKVINDSIPDKQCSASLCIRFMPHTLDNKVYFDIGADTQQQKGTLWESNVYYRIVFNPSIFHPQSHSLCPSVWNGL